MYKRLREDSEEDRGEEDKRKGFRIKKIAPRLSIKVQGTKGPLVEGELPRCKEFGSEIANQLKT